MLKRLLAKCRASLGRFENSERGVAAIEFALIAPVFFLLLGTIMETGLMFFTEWTLQTAVQDSARLVRTGQVKGNGTAAAALFQPKICNLASIIMSCSNITVYVRSDANFATLSSNLPNFLYIGPATTENTTNNTSFNTGAASQPAAVIATYDWNFTMWGMRSLGNINGGAARRLIGFAIFQNEPFP